MIRKTRIEENIRRIKERLKELKEEKKCHLWFQNRFYKMHGRYPYYSNAGDIENEIEKIKFVLKKHRSVKK